MFVWPIGYANCNRSKKNLNILRNMVLECVIIIVLLQFVQISCNFINFFHIIWQFPVKWTNINIGTSALKNRKPKSALKTDRCIFNKYAKELWRAFVERLTHTDTYQNEELAVDAVPVIIQQQHGRWGAQRFSDL